MTAPVLDVKQDDFSDLLTCATIAAMQDSTAIDRSRPRSVRYSSGTIAKLFAAEEPSVVSDGDRLWADHSVAQMLRELYKDRAIWAKHSTSAYSAPIAKSQLPDHKYYPGSATWAELLSTFKANRTRKEALQTIVHLARAAEAWTKQSIWNDIEHVSSKVLISHYTPGDTSYGHLISTLLSARGFSSEPPYEDQLGGQVLEFASATDRVAIVLHEDLVQVMTYFDGAFDSKSFVGAEKSKPVVIEYISSLLS